jgi:hypothetical protein
VREKVMSAEEVGLTRDGTYQLGVRRTLSMDVHTLWKRLVSAEGMELFTGVAETAEADAIGLRRMADDGLQTELVVFAQESHLRMRWRRPGWKNDSTLQLRVLGAARGATLSVHQEGLSDAAARAELLAHWEKAIGSLVFSS